MKNAYCLLMAVLVIILLPIASAKDYGITVVDKAENPINNALVVLERDGDTICEEETNKVGYVECEGIVSGRDYRLRVTHEDFKPINDNEALEDIPSKADEILVVMRPQGYDLEVVVVKGGSKGIRKADVSVKSLEENLYEDDFDSYDITIFPDEKSKYAAFEFDEVEKTGNDGGATFRGLEFNSMYLVIANKSQYTTARREFLFHDRAADDEVEIEIVRSGSAYLTTVIIDEEGDPVEGITVTLESESSGRNWTGTTDSSGAVTLEVESPGYFSILLGCPGYACPQPDSVFVANDEFRSITIRVSSVNSPPVADAGGDAYAMAGEAIRLDGSASYDLDSDELSFFWEDSEGCEIGSGASPEVVFDFPGEHMITLRVEDSCNLSSEDTVTIMVEEAKKCGDSVCGAGEGDVDSGAYCPADCDLGSAESSHETSPRDVEPTLGEAWPPYMSDLLISIVAIAIIIVAALLFLKKSRRRKTGLRAI